MVQDRKVEEWGKINVFRMALNGKIVVLVSVALPEEENSSFRDCLGREWGVTHSRAGDGLS